MTDQLIGVINAGSSSLKFSVYAGDERLLDGQVDGIGVRPAAKARDAKGAALPAPELGGSLPGTPADALVAIMPWLNDRLGGRRFAALGHRVVHGLSLIHI